MYKVGPVGRSAIDVSKDDVFQLNVLQHFHAHENVYFSTQLQAEYIRTIASSYEHLRQPGFGKFEVAPPQRRGNRWEERITVGESDPKFVPEFRFSKVKRRVAKPPTPGVRDPAIVRIVKDFSDAMDARGEPMEFGPFLARHRLAQAIRRF